MGMVEESEAALAAKLSVLLPHLDERQRRLLLGAEARAVGYGGIRLVARAAGAREATVARGLRELDAGVGPSDRVRRAGGGRKPLAEVDAGLCPALLALVEPDVRGDPMSPLRWTTKSTRHLAAELTRQGHRVSADTVGDLLRAEGFSLQGNAKMLEGRQHPDRDAQFHYLNEQARTHREAGQPVISVDTKKKEMVGPFRNNGQEWAPAGDPVRVSTHDFVDAALGKAVPYGVYDTTANTGWVNVGTDHDTAAFAVESIRRWWHAAGRHAYPHATRLLITADAGGSNGYRRRSWKSELAALAAQTSLAITVSHLPPGTSKWNKIEHRLFSHITMNWRGRPLTSHEVIVQTIAATTTSAGLRVHAELDTDRYPTGTTISDHDMTHLPITRHDFHGDWNYTLHPSPAPGTGKSTQATDNLPRQDPTIAYHPALIGLSPQQLHTLTADLDTAAAARREQRLHDRRGGHRQRASGAGNPGKLTLTDRVVATLLHLRLGLQPPLLAQLLTVDRTTITRTIAQIEPLLTERGLAPTQPIATRIHTLADIHAHITAAEQHPTPRQRSNQPEPAC
jgi:hypothetical protein